MQYFYKFAIRREIFSSTNFIGVMKANYIVCIATPSLPLAMTSFYSFHEYYYYKENQRIPMKWVMDYNKHPIEHLYICVKNHCVTAISLYK
jgi:hypothetical protein